MFRNNTVNRPVKTYSYVKKRRLPRDTSAYYKYEELPYYSFDTPAANDGTGFQAFKYISGTVVLKKGNTVKIWIKQLPSESGTILDYRIACLIPDPFEITINSYLKIDYNYASITGAQSLTVQYGYDADGLAVTQTIGITGNSATVELNTTGCIIDSTNHPWENVPVEFPIAPIALAEILLIGASMILTPENEFTNQVRNCKISKIQFTNNNSYGIFMPCKEIYSNQSNTYMRLSGLYNMIDHDTGRPVFSQAQSDFSGSGTVEPVEDIPPIKFTTFKKYDAPTATEKAPISLSVVEK